MPAFCLAATRRAAPVSSRCGPGGLAARAPAARSARCGCADRAATASGVPAATMLPPPAPPSGPRSITQSAVLMTSRLCSITHDGVAGVAQLVQHRQQQLDVGEVQPGGRLVEDVQRAPGVALAKLQRQLHALRLAARQRGRALAQLDVAQADVEQRLQLARDASARRRRSGARPPPSGRAPG